MNGWLTDLGVKKIDVGASGRYAKNKGAGSYIHKCKDEAEPKHYVKKSRYWLDKKAGSKHQLIVDLFKQGLSVEQISVEADVDKRYAREIVVKNGLVEKLPDNNKKSVVVHKATGEFVGEYESITSAAKATGISRTQVHRYCNLPGKSFGGFTFKYKEGVTKDERYW